MSAGEHDIAGLAARLLIPDPHNFVERPWGGQLIRRYKGVPGEPDPGSLPWGEAFEIAAYDEDDEARRYPSRLQLPDGAICTLPALLKDHGPEFLGRAFLDEHGACFPLLPKTLSVKELLSVQGHPAGHTEVYVIIDAEPGATLRLGFRHDIDAREMGAVLRRGLMAQQQLLAAIGEDIDGRRLHAIVSAWFAARGGGSAGAAGAVAASAEVASAADVLARLQADVPGVNIADAATGQRVCGLLDTLRDLYWMVLDSMNAIEVEPGQVIYNATPERVVDEHGIAVSAEVHALGNPEGREILALEIRKPGPTFRAWDNVRFPLREVDVDGALEALNLRATRPGDFLRTRAPVAGRAGVSVSVDSAFFRVEHLEPDAGLAIAVDAAPPHSLHCLAGAVAVQDAQGRPIGSLSRGMSALVPVGVGAYRIAATAPAELVRVTLPGA